MALKALNAYLRANTQSVQPGKLTVFIDGAAVTSREILGTEKRAITIDNIAGHLAIGENEIRIELTEIGRAHV